MANSPPEIKPIANDPVAGLIDIPLPREVSLWPETWASRIAVVVLFAAIVVAAWQSIRHYRVNRYRREALAEFQRMVDANATPGQLLAQLSVLLRRTALAAFPREQVASLAGSAWLSFLDRTSDGSQFSSGIGHLLGNAPYQPTPPGDTELRALTALVRQWITGHHV